MCRPERVSYLKKTGLQKSRSREKRSYPRSREINLSKTCSREESSEKKKDANPENMEILGSVTGKYTVWSRWSFSREKNLEKTYNIGSTVLGS
jgi:hypothetical protein